MLVGVLGMFRIVSTEACIAEISSLKAQQWSCSLMDLFIPKDFENMPLPTASLSEELSV